MSIRRIGHLSRQSYIRCHGHSRQWEFHFVAGGRGTFANGNIKGSFSPGTLLCSAPREVHEFQLSGAVKNFDFYYLMFEPESGMQDLLGKIHASYSLLRSVDPVKTKAVFDDILFRFTAEDPHLSRSAEYLFLSFLHDLASLARHQSSNRDEIRVRKAAAWLMAPENHARGLDALAGELGITKHHLVRVFTKTMGIPPARYAGQMRMQLACRLLATTTFPVFRIAVDLGFEDEFYFSRFFKRHIGVSPLKFRQTSEKNSSF